MIGKLKGLIGFLWRGLRDPRRRWRRLSGALLVAHAAGAAVAWRGRRALDRDPTCARTRSNCSASAPTPSVSGFACCRPCRASAPRSRSPCSRRCRRPNWRTRLRCATRPRCRARPASAPKVAERIVSELKDKAPAFANVDTGRRASCRRGRRSARAASGDGRNFGAGQSRLRPAAGGRRHSCGLAQRR